jgi:hypothetical protein
MRSRLSRRGVWLAGIATGALALTGGAAYAVIPDSGAIVHTCFSKAEGTWRPIDYPSQQCKHNERLLDLYSKEGADAAFLKSGGAAGGDLTGTYPNPRIGQGKVDGGKVADDSLTGADIDESTLGQVPSAADADKLGGQPPSHFVQNGDAAGGDLTGTFPNPIIGLGTVDSGKVADNSLTGDDIDESTLGQVPSAADSSKLGGQPPSHFVQNGDAAGGDLSGTYPNPSVKQGPGSGLDADTVDGQDSSAFLPAGRVRTTGFVALAPGDTRTLLSVNGLELRAACTAGPTTALQIASDSGGSGGFAVFSSDTTSKGTQGASVADGDSVVIASSSGGVDGGRFNAVGFFGGALSGTFVSYSGGNDTCNYETTATTDNGPSGAGFARAAQRSIARPVTH